MVFDLKARVGESILLKQEHALTQQLDSLLAADANIKMLSPRDVRRLGIFSFNIRAGKLLLHHNFVVALLNDLFGIQARGGCSCAGPYGHSLLGIDAAASAAHERVVGQGLSAFRPGWARLGVSWFFDEQTVANIGAAINFIAKRGFSLLPAYRLDAGDGVWRSDTSLLPGLAAQAAPEILTDFARMWSEPAKDLPSAPDFSTCLAEANKIADLSESIIREQTQLFDAEVEALRWFWLPEEASTELRGVA